MLIMVFLLGLLHGAQDRTVPAAGRVVVTVEGQGVQIYTCGHDKGASRWALDGPEARLLDRDTKAMVGSHTAGPTWTWTDGSAVTGKVIEKTPAAEVHYVPWLLMATQPVPQARAGVLSEVLWVRRSETHGGVAPEGGCDAAHEGATVRVPYRATYTFYVKGTGPAATAESQRPE